MKLVIEIDKEDLKETIEKILKELLRDELSKPNGISLIRSGTRDYLSNYSLFDFVKLLKDK